MALAGDVPFFDVSTCPNHTTATVVTVTGAVSGSSQGMATGSHSDETIQDFLRRAMGLLSVSGIKVVSGANASALNFQAVSGSVLSGLAQLQRELAFRIVDLEVGAGAPQAVRLASAQALIAASGVGEIQFGS